MKTEYITRGWFRTEHYPVAPLQDVLSLGSAARMNHPGCPSGNWRWRFRSDMLTDALLDRLAHFTALYQRAPGRSA